MENQQFKQSKEEPFVIVKVENKYQIAVGNNIVSRKKFDTIKQAEIYIMSRPYELIINTNLCMFYEILKTENKNKEDQKTNTNVENSNM